MSEVDAEAPQQRVSRAQRRRDKKAAAEQERDRRIAEEELANRNGPRNTELKTIRTTLRQKGLQIHDIHSDGDCLYGAVAHQLIAVGRKPMTVADLRNATAQHIRSHKDNFLPFICNPDTGDLLTDEEFEKYCCDIDKTKAWGGQVELQALSSTLSCPIHVVQSASPTIIIQGEEFAKLSEPLIITYHRHMFGLGEHYNSTKKMESDVDKSEECL